MKIILFLSNIKFSGVFYTNVFAISEENTNEAVIESMTLLENNVNNEVAKELTKNGKEKELDMDVNSKANEVFIKLIKDKLVELLGGEYVAFETEKNPTMIIIVGLQTLDKSTTTGKMANLVRKKYKNNSLLVECDIYRHVNISSIKIYR